DRAVFPPPLSDRFAARLYLPAMNAETLRYAQAMVPPVFWPVLWLSFYSLYLLAPRMDIPEGHVLMLDISMFGFIRIVGTEPEAWHLRPTHEFFRRPYTDTAIAPHAPNPVPAAPDTPAQGIQPGMAQAAPSALLPTPGALSPSWTWHVPRLAPHRARAGRRTPSVELRPHRHRHTPRPRPPPPIPRYPPTQPAGPAKAPTRAPARAA
ncbi:MAG: hypothetical protein AAGJ32_12150, partial [Pseudomonadota bacterium]